MTSPQESSPFARGAPQLLDTKLADFESALASLGGRVDLALFKFCYVDFDAHTDVGQLFDAYERLGAKYPRVTFVHVAVPLTSVQRGPTAWLKTTFTGQPAWGARENEVRQRFNALLRTHYSRVFELAQLESTRADGTASDGLISEYSDDGQHLNALGRRRAAEALLTFLSGVP